MILFWNFLSKKLFKKYKTKLLLKQRFIASSITKHWLILAILFEILGFPAPKDSKIIWLSNLLTESS
jgi:hypothetical protein